MDGGGHSIQEDMGGMLFFVQLSGKLCFEKDIYCLWGAKIVCKWAKSGDKNEPRDWGIEKHWMSHYSSFFRKEDRNLLSCVHSKYLATMSNGISW